MRLGIVIIGYDRYPQLLTSLMSLSQCGLDGKFILVDDRSPDKRIHQTWEAFPFNEKVFVQPSEHLGLPGLSLMQKLGMTQCEGCSHILFVPDDVIYNPFFGKAIEKAAEKLNKFKAVAFMEDTRGPLFGLDLPHNKVDGGYHTTGHVDGFGILMTIDTAKGLDWNINMDEANKLGRSLIWRSISNQLRGQIIATDESLIEHIGNFCNATLKKEKAEAKKIYAVNLNLFNRPEILGA